MHLAHGTRIHSVDENYSKAVANTKNMTVLFPVPNMSNSLIPEPLEAWGSLQKRDDYDQCNFYVHATSRPCRNNEYQNLLQPLLCHTENKCQAPIGN
jgi:hypothetical protein